MKMEITVAEVIELINEIKEQPASLFEMIRENVQEQVGQYLSALMDSELTQFLGRDRYIRTECETNHRNGSYGRKFTLKGIGEVGVQVPRDRNGDFKTLSRASWKYSTTDPSLFFLLVDRRYMVLTWIPWIFIYVNRKHYNRVPTC
jgi:transposase-like protein